jgi:hypothetical protein
MKIASRIDKNQLSPQVIAKRPMRGADIKESRLACPRQDRNEERALLAHCLDLVRSLDLKIYWFKARIRLVTY